MKNCIRLVCLFFISILVLSAGCTKFDIIGQSVQMLGVNVENNATQGCAGEKTYKDRLGVIVKAEYKEQFHNKEFVAESFNWKNVNNVEYGIWSEYNDSSNDRGHLTVYLKRDGAIRVNIAAKHIQTLDFVSEVYFIRNYNYPTENNRYLDRVSVIIKAEYKEQFHNKEFVAESFNWSNVDYIEYDYWLEDNDKSKEKGFITVYLKKHGEKEIDKAVKHFQTLDFVLQANYSYYMAIC